VRISLSRRVSELLVRRVFNSALLVVVALGVLAGISWWLTVSSQVSKGDEPEQSQASQAPGAGLKVVVTRLAAREISAGTSGSEVRAATAQLLDGMRGLYLQQVEARLAGSGGPSSSGMLSGATGPVLFRADEGWVDLSEGNLLLAGNIYGRRESDGMEVGAERLEYESAVDEVRLFTFWLRKANFEKRDSFMITDSGLNRLRSGTGDLPRSTHPFFQRYGGGKKYD